MHLELPLLNKMLHKPSKPVNSKVNKDTRPLCRHFLKGTCRFGHKCRYSHVLKSKKVAKSPLVEDEQETGTMYELEIRFPEGCSYPFQAPLVAFFTTNDHFPKSKCLNVTSRLLEEGRTLAADHLPAVFSMINVLENEEEMRELLAAPPLPGGVSNPYSAPNITCAAGNVSDELAGNSPGKQDNNAFTKPLSVLAKLECRESEILWKDIQKENRRLQDQFDKKQQSKSYQQMVSERQKLPAWKHQENILTAVESGQVVVVSGMTGYVYSSGSGQRYDWGLHGGDSGQWYD